ncbi:MAG: endolytic transglycosylase MltG [Candidatus Paracaedimonas acanthamoebae]|uniref:Endolytic murein transglycosylase n=1 Tax=Candidatus Paracaedimonas acanthamoebae TaxID=244581 RepID=A0A8J7PZH2_9PROT|nr:endolytic transglycosylase MltG [Candidatus Paracaedimonas acanthamoebae]
MKKPLFGFFVLLLCCKILVTAAFLLISYRIEIGDKQTHTLIIPQRTSMSQMAEILKKNHLIVSDIPFRVWACILRPFGFLKAGEYEFFPPHRLGNIIAKLQRGETVVHRFTVVEGLTSAEIEKQVLDLPFLQGESGLTEEGTLLPETYHFSYRDKRRDLIKRMQDAFQKEAQKLWQTRSSTLPYKNLQEAIILASLVEKETAISEERPRVAAVFLNRLRIGMPLQCDATILYGLYHDKGLALNRHLSKAELKASTPYNTYLHKGLPPTPICNPGRASLKAVFMPASTKELYFVANGRGGHEFSETYTAHAKHHKTWRKIRNKKVPN